MRMPSSPSLNVFNSPAHGQGCVEGLKDWHGLSGCDSRLLPARQPALPSSAHAACHTGSASPLPKCYLVSKPKPHQILAPCRKPYTTRGVNEKPCIFPRSRLRFTQKSRYKSRRGLGWIRDSTSEAMRPLPASRSRAQWRILRPCACAAVACAPRAATCAQHRGGRRYGAQARPTRVQAGTAPGLAR